MKNTLISKIFFSILILTLAVSFSSCRLIEDTISSTDGAYWDDKDYDKFTVTFSEKTRENKHVSININTLDKYGSCHSTSNYSLKNSTTYRLTRSLKSGESVRIYWWDSFHSETLYGKD